LESSSVHFVAVVSLLIQVDEDEVGLWLLDEIVKVHETEAGGGSAAHGDVFDVGSGVSVTLEVGSTVRVVVIKLGVEVLEVLFSGVADQNESKDCSDVLTEGFEFATSIVGDSAGDLVVDVDSVEKEVLADVIGEALWAVETGEHLLELFELVDVLLLGAGIDGTNNDMESVSEIRDTLGDTADVLLLEAGNGIFDINHNLLAILDAGNVVIEILSLERTGEDAHRDLSYFSFGQIKVLEVSNIVIFTVFIDPGTNGKILKHWRLRVFVDNTVVIEPGKLLEHF